MFCSWAGGDGRDRCSVPAAGWAHPVCRRVSVRPSRRGLFPDPNPNPNPNPQQEKASTTGEEMSLRCPLGCPAVPASRSLPSRSPLAFPPLRSPPLPVVCLSWPSPPPRPLSRSPSSFSKPKKTHECGAGTGTCHCRTMSGQRLPRCRPGSRFWLG